MKKFPIIFLIILLSNVSGFCGDFDNILKEAQQGDASAQYLLSLMYSTGSEVPKNEVEALKWLRLAAENGDTSAQLYYGTTLPDKIKGLRWIKKAAENGDIKAQMYLAELYLKGDNQYVSKNIDQAIHWLTVAANSNKSIYETYEAIFRLAMMYEDGEGVEKNPKKASELLGKTTDSQYFFSYIEDLYRTEKDFNNPVLLRFAAERGHSGAQCEMGLIYMYGRDYSSMDGLQYEFKVDKDKVLKWFNLAAAKGGGRPNYELGRLYHHGMMKEINGKYEYVIKPNGLEAHKYYRNAAIYGHKEAQEEIDKINKYDLHVWGKKYMENGSLTIYRDYSFSEIRFKTDVGFSQGGNKRVYFSISEPESICKPENFGSNESRSVWEFDNQAVHMNVYCGQDDDNIYYIYATPGTARGLNYVVDKLKKSPDKISVEGFGYKFPISAKGFTKVWSRHSASAL